MLDGDAVQAIGEYAQSALDAVSRIALIDGVEYSTTPLHDTRHPEPVIEPVRLSTLSGLVAYTRALLSSEQRSPGEPPIFHVESASRVSLVSQPFGRFRQREFYASAKNAAPASAGHLGFAFGKWLGRESFVISLQALFEPTDDLVRVQRVLGTITSESGATTRDDGVTQRVEVKAGLSMVGSADIPNPVVLRPHRTFPEVGQPASPFVLRVREDRNQIDAALFEADGGAWEVDAIARIELWLQGQVPNAIILG